MLTAPSVDFINELKGLLGPRGWRDPAEAPAYLEEPRGRETGQAALILCPARLDQVAAIVARANAAKVGIIPYGGGTGLVLGQIAPDGPPPLVVSLERMNEIREIEPGEEALVAGAGAVLTDAQEAASRAGRLLPLSLASQGSARIGGLLSTNAGGINVLRYGNARDLVLGIEAVLPDGSVLRGPSTLRKDNAGFDLRHLLIGAEGALGIITAAALKLSPRPAETASAFCAVPHPKAAGVLLRLLRDHLGETVSAFELMSWTGMAFLAETCPDAPKPPLTAPWLVLMEVGGAEGVGATLEQALAAALEKGLANDAVIAQSEAQRAAFWRIREEIPVANRRIGAVASHDVSVPLASLPRFIAAADRAVAQVDPALRINCFGHLGDGNLHYNIFPPKGRSRDDFRDRRGAATRAVHDLVHEMGGSISAEHGIGRLKPSELTRYADPAKLAAMRAIKAALDPNGIMNPGAVLTEHQ